MVVLSINSIVAGRTPARSTLLTVTKTFQKFRIAIAVRANSGLGINFNKT